MSLVRRMSPPMVLIALVSLVLFATAIFRSIQGEEDREAEPGEMIIIGSKKWAYSGEQSTIELLALASSDCSTVTVTAMSFIDQDLDVYQLPPFGASSRDSQVIPGTSLQTTEAIVKASRDPDDGLYLRLLRVVPEDADLQALSSCLSSTGKALVASVNSRLVGGRFYGGPHGAKPVPLSTITPAANHALQSGLTKINMPAANIAEGDGVSVAILDTSPDRLPGTFSVTNVQGGAGSLAFDVISKQQPVGASTGDTIESHGLFVAGLVHSVAPKATLTLYRVLEDDGDGSMWLVERGMADFATAVAGPPALPAVMVLPMSEKHNYSCVEPPASPGPWTGVNATIETMLSNLVSNKVVVVGMAGNSGNVFESSTPQNCQLEYPGSSPHVLAAAGVFYSSGAATAIRSCFSSLGEVSAFAGQATGGCNHEQQDDMVISVVATPGAPTTYHYAGWTGTSFSAATVGGLAARWQQINWATGAGTTHQAAFSSAAISSGIPVPDWTPLINVANTAP